MKRTTCSRSAIDPAKAGERRGMIAAKAGSALRTAIIMTDQYHRVENL
jgi:hypothetical protein